MVRPNEVTWLEIERAKEFVRQPLTDGFKAWSTLRDRDNVTMTIHELAHLMAWYAAVRMGPAPTQGELDRLRADNATAKEAETGGEKAAMLSLTEGHTHG